MPGVLQQVGQHLGEQELVVRDDDQRHGVKAPSSARIAASAIAWRGRRGAGTPKLAQRCSDAQPLVRKGHQMRAGVKAAVAHLLNRNRPDEIMILLGRSQPQKIVEHGGNVGPGRRDLPAGPFAQTGRSEEHTSELQSLMRISYAVFCLKKKNHTQYTNEKDKTKR